MRNKSAIAENCSTRRTGFDIPLSHIHKPSASRMRAAFEAQTREHVPPAMAYDLALMFEAWQNIGVMPMPGAVERLTAMLDRPPKSYRAYAEETAAQWRS